MDDTFFIEFPPEAKWFAAARLFAASIARHYGCSESSVEDLKLAMSEACNNAVAALEGQRGPALISAGAGSDRLSFTISGGGHPALDLSAQGLAAQAGSSGDPGTMELAGILGAELVRALFAGAEVTQGAGGLKDLRISLPIGRVQT